MIKKITLILLASLFFVPSAFALSRDGAINEYKQELSAAGMTSGIQAKAERDVDAAIRAMEASQSDVAYSYEALDDRVAQVKSTDARKKPLESKLETAEDKKDAFIDLAPESHLFVEGPTAGSLPRVVPARVFKEAETAALEAISAVNRQLIAPARPGAVPEGDIVSDFIPQVIRQLFRFAWLVLLPAFTASGVMLIMAQGDEERVTKAKKMIYYSLMGFAFIVLAFALVKAVTDIDFFRFI